MTNCRFKVGDVIRLYGDTFEITSIIRVAELYKPEGFSDAVWIYSLTNGNTISHEYNIFVDVEAQNVYRSRHLFDQVSRYYNDECSV